MVRQVLGGGIVNLKMIRKLRGLTMKQVAEAANISESAVCLYESGKRHPNLSTAYRIAKVLNVSLDELVGIKKKVG